jgi:hypothetical protein
VGAAYTVNGKGTTDSIVPNGAAEKFILAFNNVPLANWQYNDAFLQGTLYNNNGGNTCTVIVTPITPNCGLKNATLSGMGNLPRTSIGRPTCTDWELEVASSGCIKYNLSLQ